MDGRFAKRIGFRWLAAFVALAVAPLPAWPQEYVAVPQSLELPRGVKVDAPHHLRGEALAEVLENYARQLRGEALPGPAWTNAALAAQPVKLSISAKVESRKVESKQSEYGRGASHNPGNGHSTKITTDPVAAGPVASDPVVPDPVVSDPAVSGPVVPDKSAAPAREMAAADVEAHLASLGPQFTFGERRWTFLPSTLLWQPPLANPHEPRFYVKRTNLKTSEFNDVVDFSIGGTLAMFRVGPADRPHDGVQLDLFATTLSRFINYDAMTAIDYRAGLPLTFARGRWSAKLSYEHTSTHLGDEFLLSTGTRFRSATRDELAAGLAYRVLEPVRVYGTLVYAMSLGSFVDDPDPMRYTMGAEWSRPVATGVCGQPFAALDVEFRGNEDFTPNLTAQLGWQWLAWHGRPGLRAMIEYYDGRSPYGQLGDRHESWVGFGLAFDY
ncbi:MAG: DUF1207 domain-containing protein [Gemmataceae bacterium]|nr:DUF1207 domain-containing protein [Gemmataceae bacterium]